MSTATRSAKQPPPGNSAASAADISPSISLPADGLPASWLISQGVENADDRTLLGIFGGASP